MKHLARIAAAVTSVSMALALAASSSAAVNALIVGKVMSCGGPAPGRCTLQEHAVVSAFNSRHRLVARESITNGHFSFLLRPGRFTLVAKIANGRAKRSVRAKADKTVHANVIFQIK